MPVGYGDLFGLLISRYNGAVPFTNLPPVVLCPFNDFTDLVIRVVENHHKYCLVWQDDRGTNIEKEIRWNTCLEKGK